jgi:hypothetical protein
MILKVYYPQTETIDFLNLYRDLYYNSKLTFLASDLLKEGLTMEDLNSSIQKAIRVCKNAGIKIEKHFLLINTTKNNVSVNDCKLSAFSYGLVILNADINNEVTSNLQVQLMQYLFQNNLIKQP